MLSHWLGASFLIYLQMENKIKPRSKKHRFPKVNTFEDYLFAVRRVIRSFHANQQSPCFRAARVIRAFHADFMASADLDDQLPHRKKPIDRQTVSRILQLPNGSYLGRRQVQWSNHFGVSMRAMILTACNTGFRKAEMTISASQPFKRGRLSRRHLRWRVRGVDYDDPTPELLLSMKQGDWAVIIPPISKCDKFGLYFSSRPVWLYFNANDEENAAEALRDLELRFPISGASRQDTPLFFMDSSFSPMSSSQADLFLKYALALLVPTALASQLSWHSFRIMLATALTRARVAPGTIQALLRWKTEESIKIYARIEPGDYHQYLELAKEAGRSLSSVESSSLISLVPEHSPDEFQAELHALGLHEEAGDEV